MDIPQSRLIQEAHALSSEHGGNPEYDRALLEILYWTDPNGNAKEAWADILELDLSILYPHK